MSAVLRPRPLSDARLRLLVFHHAGGSAAGYYPLIRTLPDDWDLVVLELPGRGGRHAEAPVEDMAELIGRSVADSEPWLDSPYALFGHSLGAILATEVGRTLEARGARPAWVGVSGRVAPTLQGRYRGRLHELPDDELLAALERMGGMPARIGDLPEFRDRFLAVARTDLRAVDTYRPVPGRVPLSSPLTAFGGLSDPWAPCTTMPGWSLETRGGFRQRLFPGGHFYFLGAAFAEFTRELVAEVRHRLPVAA